MRIMRGYPAAATFTSERLIGKIVLVAHRKERRSRKQRCARMEEIYMRQTETFLTDTVLATLAIYAEMRRRTADEQDVAADELRRYLPS